MTTKYLLCALAALLVVVLCLICALKIEISSHTYNPHESFVAEKRSGALYVSADGTKAFSLPLQVDSGTYGRALVGDVVCFTVYDDGTTR